MKKIYLLALTCVVGFSVAKAQSFSDDFESYTESKLGPQSNQWTTWSGVEGGNDDPSVVSTKAHSGTKSVYFVSTVSGGGPVDCVLPFGGPYESGTFTFKAWFNVEAGKGAYFNFQGSTKLGELFPLNCQMDEKNNIVLYDDKGKAYLSTTYTSDTWFELTIEANLTINEWSVFIDGVNKGSFAASINKVSSLDIYPVNASNSQAGYWVDDVSYNYVPYTLLGRDGAVTGIMIPDGLAGQQRNAQVNIRNLGTQAITSFDLEIDYNGSVSTQAVTGVNIPSLGTYTVNVTNPITLLAGSKIFKATIKNINAVGADDAAGNDSKSLTTNPVVPAPGKKVLAEEGTGTWCQWCPRGAVAMRTMEQKYHGYFVGVAVHNNDPMVNKVYDTGIGSKISGYPGALVDRGPYIDAGNIEQDFIKNITRAPKAVLANAVKYNNSTRELEVTVTTTFKEDATGNYGLICVLTEDSVTGTTAKYAQANAYAGGGNGEMGGYENLGNPVPAKKMVYDHVARDIQPSFLSNKNDFKGPISANAVYTNTYTFKLDSTWKLHRMHAVSILIAPNGMVDNAGTEEFGSVGINAIASARGKAVLVYPNPSNDGVFSVANVSNANISVLNLLGQEVYRASNVSGNYQIDLSAQPAGIYLLKVAGKDLTGTTKVTIAK